MAHQFRLNCPSSRKRRDSSEDSSLSPAHHLRPMDWIFSASSTSTTAQKISPSSSSSLIIGKDSPNQQNVFRSSHSRRFLSLAWDLSFPYFSHLERNASSRTFTSSGVRFAAFSNVTRNLSLSSITAPGPCSATSRITAFSKIGPKSQDFPESLISTPEKVLAFYSRLPNLDPGASPSSVAVSRHRKQKMQGGTTASMPGVLETQNPQGEYQQGPTDPGLNSRPKAVPGTEYPKSSRVSPLLISEVPS